MGGREGPRPHARAALRHRASSRASAATTPSHAARRSSATASTCSGSASSAELYYMPLPYDVEELRTATHELIARNGLRSCYIRPIVFRGYGQMGLNPLDAPVDVAIAVVGVGRLPRRGGQAERRPREGLQLAAHQPRLADPARQGLRPVPQQRAGEDRVARRPATRRRSCSTTTATSARARARTSSSSATARSSRRRRPRRSSTASRASRSIQIARDLGSRSWSATSRAPSSTSPTRSS